ncbi:MAG: ABC transporter permease [Planctomycetota bacterium]
MANPRKPISRLLRTLLPGLVSAAVLVLFWDGCLRLVEVKPIILPPPLAVAKAFSQYAGKLGMATLVTGSAAVFGLAMASALGVFLAMVMSQFRPLRLALMPYVIALQTVPIVAIAPLLIIWSGYNYRTVLIVTVIVCLFPIVGGTLDGLLRTQSDHEDLFQVYRAGRWKRFRRLQLPSAIASMVTGIKTAAGLSVIGAIIAEFFVGSGTPVDGLGTLMTVWQVQYKTDALIAAVIAATFLGIVIFSSINVFSQLVLKRWMPRSA